MSLSGRSFAIVAVATVLTCVARADVVTLPSVRDNTLYEEPNGALSNGAGGTLFAGRVSFGGGQLLRRGLVQFDLSPIPPSSTITAVQLSMTVTNVGSSASGTSVTVQRTLASWGEGMSAAAGNGGSGAPATPGDATWAHRFFPGTFWATAGGDFVSTSSAAATVPVSPGAITWSSPGLVADVQSWVNSPSSNFGWLILGTEGIPASAIGLATRENFNLANRPVLMVTFTPVPEPSAVGLACAIGWVVARRLRRRR